MNIKKLICFVLLILPLEVVQSQQNKPNIFVFSKTEAFRHKSIPTGIKFMTELANKNNWSISFSEDSNDFTIENLKQYNVLVFLNVPNSQLTLRASTGQDVRTVLIELTAK